jgi:exodeoxyribonuclease VII large subunit
MKLVDYQEDKIEYSVSEISTILKKHIENNFASVRIKGEVSGCKIAPSGHVYLSLKDKDSVLSAIIWKGVYLQNNVKLEDGLEIICTGNITTFSGQSKYQLIVQSISLAGLGSLMLLLEQRKQQFLKEGLFDASHKKNLPYLPKQIGIITSITGAVIKDIIHRIKERFPLNVIVWSVLVQGEKSAVEIVKAIEGFNNLDQKPDLLIIARGGGSIEDLWSFNEEIVIRAAFASKLPIISAVGHETDTTLLDYVADKRAPTPTAAAEIAVPVKTELLANIKNISHRLNISFLNFTQVKHSKLKLLHKSMPQLNNILLNKMQRYDDLTLRLLQANKIFLEIKKAKFDNIASNIRAPKNIISELNNKLNMQVFVMHSKLQKYFLNIQKNTEYVAKILDSLSYKNTLQRGFTIIRQNNSIITSKKNLTNNDITIEFNDGIVQLKKS